MVQGIDATFSLLQKQQQDRADEIARRERKNERNKTLSDLLVKGGVAIGNAFLERKTQDFINSTEQRGLTQMAAAADNNVARFQSLFKKIDDSGKGAKQYFMNQLRPGAEEQLNSETEDYRENQDIYEGVLQRRLSDAADAQVKIINEAREIIESRDMDDFEAKLDLLQQRFTDSNIEDFVLSKITNFGKTKEDLAIEEMLAFKDFVDNQTEGTRGYYAKQLEDLVRNFELSGDLVLSKAFMQENAQRRVMPEATEEEKIVTKTERKIEVLNNKLIIIEQDKSMDRTKAGADGQPFWEPQGEPRIRAFGSEKGEDINVLLSEAEQVQALGNTLPFKDFLDKMDEGRLDDYHQRLIAADTKPLGMIQTLEEYGRYVDVTLQFMAEKETYLTRGQLQFEEAAIATLLKEGGEFSVLLREYVNPKTTPERQQELLPLLFKRAAMASQQISRSTRDIDTDGSGFQPQIIGTRRIDQSAVPTF